MGELIAVGLQVVLAIAGYAVFWMTRLDGVVY